MNNDLISRLFSFGARCLKFIRKLPAPSEYKVIKNQLAKSATPAGANYEESQTGSSMPGFANKIKISLREMRESNYWLRMIRTIEDNGLSSEGLEWLIDESKQLKKYSALF